jgi:DNA-binding response OmpR family regulator
MEALRILIVDDEPEWVSALAERLGLRGFAATGVTDGEAALARLRAGAFDVALVDVKMPGLGGLDLVRAIKAQWPELPVILLTGHSSAPDAERGLALGAWDCLLKPVQIDALVRAVRAAVHGEGTP